MQYFIILGKNPKLSSLEFESIKRGGWQIKHQDNNPWLLLTAKGQTDSTLNFSQKLLARLGGTIKIGIVLKELHLSQLEETENYIEVIKELNTEKKINFGFSVYAKNEDKDGSGHRPFRGNGGAPTPTTFGLKIKKELKKFKIKSRLVVSKKPLLSSAVVTFNKMLPPLGIEFVIIPENNKYLIGHTLAVQDFESYSKRDYGRPRRDYRSGMLPPKLAKIMINLAQAKKSDTILDPFCGSGTILTESLLLGYKKLIGTDISLKAVQSSKENINFAKSEPALNKASGGEKSKPLQLQIFQADVRAISSKIPANSIDCIITEPHLGPPLKGSESLKQIQAIANELTSLYLKSFQEFKKILKPKSGRIVIVFPVFVFKKQKKYLSRVIENKFKKIGFQILPLFLQNAPVLYFREKQRVWREIKGYYY